MSEVMQWFFIIFQLLSFFFVGLFIYLTGKLCGFNTGLEYLRKKAIRRCVDGQKHSCNVTTSNVVCFEREGELWVKEYGSPQEKEGRTYMVFHCPWCGYQTGKSKMHEKVKMSRPAPKIPSSEGC